MFNEINFTDRSNEYVNNFNVMPNEVLKQFASIEGLSFTPDQLFYIRDYFIKVKNASPTYAQLSFLNAINLIRKSKKNDLPIYSASAPDGMAREIIATSQDLLAKKNVIDKKIYGAMPISFAAEIASEYLKYAGLAEKNDYFSVTEEKSPTGYYINQGNGDALFAHLDSDANVIQPIAPANTPNSANALATNNAIIMLCPMQPMDNAEYSARVNALLSLPEIAMLISDCAEINKNYTLYDFLKNETNGIFADISRLPDIQRNEFGRIDSLMPLLEACYGRTIFATNFASLAIINRISGMYGLILCHFAMRNDTKTFTIDATKAPSFAFDFDFLSAIENFKEPHEYIFSDECSKPLDAKIDVFLTDNRKVPKQSYRAERILNFGKIIATASARELTNAPFKTASVAVLDAINGLVAKGVALNDISLLISYSMLGGTDDNAELGKNLSAVLGAYRTMIELCISDSTPKINYNNDKRSITVLASAKPPMRKIASSFSNGNTYLYFLPYCYDAGGFIDYGSYRSSVREFYSFIETDTVISAFAVSENLNTLIDGVRGNMTISYNEEFNASAYATAHGILFESKTEISGNSKLICIGKTLPNSLQAESNLDNTVN